MLQDVPGTDADFERIQVPAGPWPIELDRHHDWAYFPDDSLVSVSPSRLAWGDAVIAVVGHHGFWLPGMLTGRPLHAQVLRAGHVHRVDWSIVQRDPQRYAPWLIRAAQASQRMMGQMAQLAFCAKHHTPTQRMASWLLVCRHESVNTSLPASLGGIQSSLREQDQWLVAALSQCHGKGAVPASLVSLDQEALAVVACTCHRYINDASQ